jgi:hypothetical protein
MAAMMPIIRTAMLILLGCAAMCLQDHAQTVTAASPRTESAPTEAPTDTPLPDVVAMMHDVEINQRKAEAIEKDYIYHSVETEQELDGHGQTKKATVNEFDHYWVNGVPVRRLVSKNGKLLSAEEMAKEDERIDKRVSKAREKRDKADTAGKETDPRGQEEITVSRLLELGAFSNARRVKLNGRDTIAVDYAGDPKAKTRNRPEEVIRDLVGTAWIDERDRVLVRVEGHFVNSFKVGGGLVVNIQKDTHFAMEQTKVNDEVWLPAKIDGQGSARVFLFFNFNGSVRAVESDYRKFRATATILPGAARTDTLPVPEGSVQP